MLTALADRALTGDRYPREGQRPPFSAGPRWAGITSALCSVIVMGLGCGGGGGGGGAGTGDDTTIPALELPERIQMTQVEEASVSGAAQTRAAAASAVTRRYDGAGTDYTNQEKEAWVEDTEVLNIINSILGVCHDARYQAFVNQGPYKALVRKIDDEQAPEQTGTTTSTATEELVEVIIEVTRASGADPMIIRFWMDESDDDEPWRIRGYFEVMERVSDRYPYGLMDAHFKANTINEDGTDGAEVMTAVLKVGADDAGNVVVQWKESGNEDEEDWREEWETEARIIADASLSVGKAYIHKNWDEEEDNGWAEVGELTDYYAFDQDYLRISGSERGTERHPGGQDEPYDETYEEVLDKHDFEYQVYWYKLFDYDTGAEVESSSGFPIEFPGGGHGYIGYHGMWTSSGDELPSGTVVTRVNWHDEEDTEEQYTVFRAPGKLVRHRRQKIPLGDLTGTEFYKWVEGGQEHVVVWDGSNFRQIGERRHGDSGPVIEYYEEGEVENVAFEEWDGAWCEQLDAHFNLGQLYENGRFPNNEDWVYFHTNETVQPTDEEAQQALTLYYWGYTPQAPITRENLASYWEDERNYWSPNATEKTYVFRKADGLLYQGGTPLVLNPGALALEGTRYEGGLWLEPLTTTQYTEEDSGQAHRADVYYCWRSGPGDGGWENQLFRRSRRTVQLGELANGQLEFHKWIWDEEAETGVSHVVIWNGENLLRTGVISDEYDPEDPRHRTDFPEDEWEPEFFEEWEGAWCPEWQGGPGANFHFGELFADGGAPDNKDTVSYHEEEVVDPAALGGDLTLYYWGYAPDPPVSQDEVTNADTLEQDYWDADLSQKTYVFDPVNFVLREGSLGGPPVVLDPALTPAALEEAGHGGGFHLGPLTIRPVDEEDWWQQANQEEVHYSWETGPNEWNQFATVRDSAGEFVTFERPLRFEYIHRTANDLNGESGHDGKTFILEYDGLELHMPWEYVPEEDDWECIIHLKDETKLTAPDGKEYVVKGIEMELEMREVDASRGAHLDIDTTIPPPDAVYDSSKTGLVGPVPTNAALKVVKGELVR